ncbi:MAG: hypothetical protein ABIR79_18565 [Candidatus Binatia bacterium]
MYPTRRAGFVLTLLALCATIAVVAPASAGELDERIDDSLALCIAADQLPANERLSVLARGLDLADAALALDDRSARAHFAVVCNLGKATALAGTGFGSLGAVYRLRREIDATLALAPNHAEALAAKGALLVKLPRWLGGDRREAERWLRRALAIDPSNDTARVYLDELAPAPAFVAPAAAEAAVAH